MNHLNPALRAFSDSLADVVAKKDEMRLREILQGRTTPALGGSWPPSEIVRQALFQATDVRSLALGLAALLARIVHAETETLFIRRAVTNSNQRALVLEALRLATELPAQPELFRALRDLLAEVDLPESLEGEEVGTAPFRRALWEALSYQQTDASLTEDWLALISESLYRKWSPGERTLLLIAWRGLLWIPPNLRLDRIETGLLALARSVRGHEEAEDLLQEALEILRDTFPRSAEFWEENLGPRIGDWPEGLRTEVLKIWPGLQPHERVRVSGLAKKEQLVALRRRVR